MNIKLKESFKFILEIGIVILVISLAAFYGFYYKINDIKDAGKAETTLSRIVKLRTALEKYQEIAGNYPDFVKEDETRNNLSTLDYFLENGKKISFKDIYGEESIEPTVGTEELPESNFIYPIADFKNSNLQGGWSYNKKTGEIRANLPENIYGQNIIWIEE